MSRILTNILLCLVVGVFGLLLSSGCMTTDDSVDASRRLRAQGDRYLEQGLFKEAENEYRRALHHSPEDAAITYQLGKVYLQSDRAQDAETWLRKTLELNPGSRISAEVHYHLRELEVVRGESTGTAEDLSRLLKQLTETGDLNAHAAAIWAASLANDQCQVQWQRRPFSPECFPCNRTGDKWHWGRLDPAGVKGFSAIVSFEMDGLTPSVEVYFSSDQATPRMEDLPRY